jgi:hypothetical protein
MRVRERLGRVVFIGLVASILIGPFVILAVGSVSFATIGFAIGASFLAALVIVLLETISEGR